METNSKTRVGVSAVIVAGLMVAFAIGAWAQAAVFAAPAHQSSPTTPATPAKNATTSQAGSATEQQLTNLFMTNFAARLGVDQNKLQSSFTAAANDTADQALSQGLITQDQATEAKSAVQKMGFAGMVQRGFDLGGNDGAKASDEYTNPKQALMQALQTLGIPTDEVRQGIDANKSLADIAGAHNISVQTLKSTILSTFRQQLDGAVHDSHITQAQADEQYNTFAAQVDTIISTANNTSK